MAVAVDDVTYRCPIDLQVTPTELRRVMIVGSCLSRSWPTIIEESQPGCSSDFYLINNSTVLPEDPPGHAAADYDCQIIQLPLRSILPEAAYFNLRYDDVAGYQELFSIARERLLQFLDEAMRWNKRHSLLTFVGNFLVPQQNPMGRLLPRYDLRNFVYFVEMLNQALFQALGGYNNAYLLDLDQIASTLGRRYLQDDAVLHVNHASALSAADHKFDLARLEVPDPATEIYPVRPYMFVKAAWAEVASMYRSIRQIDNVKLVIVDIDDTLWRGVGAELDDDAPSNIEGWPLGFAEALTHLRRRGVLLGVVSKNDEAVVRKRWVATFGARMKIDDFAFCKINWRSKPDNIEEILRESNLLARSTVFVDDNPVEREAVKMAYPGIRTLGSNPYLWRRILLWSPETQLPTISEESTRRSEMVQAQVRREDERRRLSREEFLGSLQVMTIMARVSSVDDPAFPRVFELVNKTNQFNTTGRRWSHQEFVDFFAHDGEVVTMKVCDKFTEYGLVGVLMVRDGVIEQFVMSCRVVGLDVEIAALSHVVGEMAERGRATVQARLVDTGANGLCRTLYPTCGFELAESDWSRSTEPPLIVPDHIRSISDPTAGRQAA